MAASVNKLGLIAGNGVFPLEVARAARARGIKIIAVAHLNESDRALDSVADEVTWIKVGELQKIVDVFKNAGVSEAAMAGGISRARLAGVNEIGLQRRGFSAEKIAAIKAATRTLFFSKLLREDAIAKTLEEYGDLAEVRRLVDFIKNSERGVVGRERE